MKKLFFSLFACAALFTQVAHAQTARVMAIHNSPDTALRTVDVWLTTPSESRPLINDFEFRKASGFIDAPAGQNIRLSFAPANSTSITDTLIGFGFNLTANETYVLLAQGTVFGGYTPAQPFGLTVITPVRERVIDSNFVYLSIVHGSTDAPEVELVVRQGNDEIATLDPIAFNESIVGATLPTSNYFIDINVASSGDLFKTLNVPLETLGLNDSAVVVFASGFLNPANNNNGAAFGVFAALSNGTVVEVPFQETFRLQAFHNCPDSAARIVDIWLVNNTKSTATKILSNFEFRNATPFINAPAVDDIAIGIALPGSTTQSDIVYREEIGQVPGGVTAFAAAVGVLDAAGYKANPNGVNIGLQITGSNAAEKSETPGKVLLNVLHGSTDAPEVDVRVAGGPALFSGLRYTDASEFGVEVDPGSYTIDITAAGSTTPVVSYTAPLTSFADSALVIVASGFLSPSENKNGPAFGLFAVTPSGNVIALPVFTSVKKVNATVSASIFPNPSNGLINITTESNITNIVLTDMSGRTIPVKSTALQNTTTLDLTDLNKGIYIVNVETEKGTAQSKVVIQ